MSIFVETTMSLSLLVEYKSGIHKFIYIYMNNPHTRLRILYDFQPLHTNIMLQSLKKNLIP